MGYRKLQIQTNSSRDCLIKIRRLTVSLQDFWACLSTKACVELVLWVVSNMYCMLYLILVVLQLHVKSGLTQYTYISNFQ